MKIKLTVLLMVLIAAVVAKDTKYRTSGNETLPDPLMKQAPKPSDEPLQDPLVKQAPEPSDEPLLDLLVKQVMSQQLYSAERTRSEGDSGIKQVTIV